MSQDELVDVIDGRGNFKKVVSKKQAHLGGLLHRTVISEVIDSEGRWLLTKPSKGRQDEAQYVSPIGGHVRAGESEEDALRREAAEELGLEGYFKYEYVGRAILNRFVVGRQENHFFIVFKIYSDAKPIFNHEAESGKYFTVNELRAELSQRPELFGNAFRFVVQKFFPELGNQPEAPIALVWDYLQMHQQVQKADCILALGSHDVRVAHRAVELYKQGYAPYIVFSGGFGRLTGDFPKPEAEVFADEAEKLGVPRDKMFIENESTNTGENIKLSMQLLKEKELDPQSFILVTKPYMERRAYAAFKKLVPDKHVIPTSPLYSFAEAPYTSFDQEEVIHIMIGDLQRIKVYPVKGFQIPQAIPDKVWSAYIDLVARGYKKYLISD
ncbi:MAG TPA: ElyC/SanA/YdcF family protein [Patescibacteria group bacterium]|nr:ElyC/SanA/YdcF family protein [Patescibacteria group bacterium]